MKLMNGIRNRVARALAFVYSYGILLCLLAGGLTFFGYLAAIIIGGEIAEQICVFIFKRVFPIIITASTILVVVGLLKMYLAGETALSIK